MVLPIPKNPTVPNRDDDPDVGNSSVDKAVFGVLLIGIIVAVTIGLGFAAVVYLALVFGPIFLVLSLVVRDVGTLGSSILDKRDR